jgi:hypothetical protein
MSRPRSGPPDRRTAPLNRDEVCPPFSSRHLRPAGSPKWRESRRDGQAGPGRWPVRPLPLRQRHRCLYYLVMPIGKKIKGGMGASPPGSGGGGCKQDRQGGPASPVEFRLGAASGVAAYLQLARQVEHRCGWATSSPATSFPRPGTRSPRWPSTRTRCSKAYRGLETKGLTLGQPGQGTFIEATLSQVARYGGTAHRAVRWTRGPAERVIKGTPCYDDRVPAPPLRGQRFWPFQLIERGWLLVVAMPLPAATARFVRHRAT